MAVFAGVAEFPPLIEGLFCGAKATAADGKYTVELYSTEAGGWTAIEVDDYIPAEWRHGNPQPVFSHRSWDLAAHGLPGRRRRI